MIVSFSGCDGAGKSTQINELMKSLESNGYKVKYVWSRGGYTPTFSIAKICVLWVFGKKKKVSKKLTKLDKDYSNRRQKILHNRTIARIWLSLAILDIALLYGVYVRCLSKVGIIVICDRYVADTKIDFERNFPGVFSDEGILWRLFVFLAPRPEISVVITVPTNVSLARSKLKKEPFPDSEETLEFRLNCYKTRPEFYNTKTLRIDGTNSVDNSHKIINDAVLLLC